MWKSITSNTAQLLIFNHSKSLRILFILTAAALLPVQALAIASAQLSQAEQSFAKFSELVSLNSTDISELYADDARIEYIVMDGWKLQQATFLSGKQYKQRLAGKTSESSALFNGRSEFQNVDFFTNGPRIGFFGIRYSHENCFSDEQYFVIFERAEDDSYRIVRERIETPPASLCDQPPKTLAKPSIPAAVGSASFNTAAHAFEEDSPFVAEITLEKIAKQLEENPPKQLDVNTEFVSFVHKEHTMTYTHRLTRHQSNPKYDGLLKGVIKVSLVRKTCKNPRLTQVLDYNGEIKYDYQDKADKDIFTVEVIAQDCKKLSEAESESSSKVKS